MNRPKLIIERIADESFIYRKKISSKTAYKWHLAYRNTDLYVASSKNIIDALVKHLIDFYEAVDRVSKTNPAFLKSLSPLRENMSYPEIINEMVRKSAVYGVGPMASIAGAVCDYIGRKLMGEARTIIIENGGDIFIKSGHQVIAGIYTENIKLGDKLKLKIQPKNTPCGLCSSSGTMGHSLSLGKTDLVSVLASTTISADAAATALANRISEEGQIQSSIEEFKKMPALKGILVIKSSKIGLWGQMELVG